MGGGTGGGSQASMRHLTNIFRRVYRIFAHAWFQHRGVFWQVEGYEGLYVFFKTVCDVYQLIPEDNYTIPIEAEGSEGDTMETPVERKPADSGKMSLLKKSTENGQSHRGEDDERQATAAIDVAATTRRHKHTPSTGSHVTTIAESHEEEDEEEQEEQGEEREEESGEEDEEEKESGGQGEEDPPTQKGGESDSAEVTDTARGRTGPSSEENLTRGLGKLSLGDLSSTANSDGPAENPTPQRQSAETNPMDTMVQDHKDTSEEVGPATSTTPSGLAVQSEKEGEEEEEGEKKEEEGKEEIHAAEMSEDTIPLQTGILATDALEGQEKRAEP